MDKNQMIGEILWLYDERERLVNQVSRLTTERSAAYTRLMKVTGADRVCAIPDGEELLVDRMLRFAKSELKRCLITPVIGEDMTYEEFADSVINTWRVPKELSVEDVTTILDDEIKRMYETAKADGVEQEEDDE